jgi:adenylosuccinate synthase
MEPRSSVTVIRFNGGPQAGHNVMTPEGLQHKHSHFGSGTLVPGVRTHLSKFMLCSPWCMLVEEETLRSIGITDAMDRTSISEDCLVITPFHRIANRLRERARGDGRHGSCGIGFGETMKDSVELEQELDIRMSDFRDPITLVAKLERVRLYKLEQMRREGIMDVVRHMREAIDEIDELVSPMSSQIAVNCLGDFCERANIVGEDYVKQVLESAHEAWVLVDLGFGDQCKGSTVDFLVRQVENAVVLEPAQGVLLDEWRGFHPHTTWSTCTMDNANMLLEEHSFSGRVRRLGILRAYATRHGAGPFVTEDAVLGESLPEFHGDDTIWTGDFRVGYFDAVSARYAIACCGGPEAFDGLVITCLDRLAGQDKIQLCAAYNIQGVREPCHDHFVVNGSGIVFNMRLGVFQDLDHQEELTRRLEQVRPMYRSLQIGNDFESMADIFVWHIMEELHVPVVLTSWGPTHTDKQWDPIAHLVLGDIANVA